MACPLKPVPVQKPRYCHQHFTVHCPLYHISHHNEPFGNGPTSIHITGSPQSTSELLIDKVHNSTDTTCLARWCSKYTNVQEREDSEKQSTTLRGTIQLEKLKGR
uniref:Uncharacterized protein n=1 Tax=Anguilla anguilla TaxID=7936 RepID=A0A0E9QV11_ANGAN